MEFGLVMLGFGFLIILGWIAFQVDRQTGVLKSILNLIQTDRL